MAERIYFSMRETIDATGIEAPTLRYWEKQFEQLNPRKDGHGNRYYTAEDIALIKRIRFIRDEMKITRIQAIRNELQSSERQTDVRSEAVERLTRIRRKLEDLERLLCILLVCVPMLMSCRGDGVLSKRKMVAVITDLHRMDGILQVTGVLRDPETDEVAYYDAVLASHGVTMAQFDSSLVWYTHHPQRFNKLYPLVLKNLDAEHELYVDETAHLKAVHAERKEHFRLFTCELAMNSTLKGYPLNEFRLPPVDTLHVQIPMRK